MKNPCVEARSRIRVPQNTNHYRYDILENDFRAEAIVQTIKLFATTPQD
jgi:hypothetical protein